MAGIADRVPLDFEVVPGVSAVHALAARHRIPLNRVGRAVQITPARLIAGGMPDDVDDVVVMLDAGATFAGLEPAGIHIYWGAYLGTEDEILISGPLGEVAAEIARVREEAEARRAGCSTPTCCAAAGSGDGPVLILGGTAEARALAQALSDAGVPIVSSLAGRVAQPRLPVGEVRMGGFGGPVGLAQWLVRRAIVAVVDATHPFAERISASAAEAATRAGIPLLRLERPAWQATDGDRWHRVEDLPQAADAVRRLDAQRVLLTTGRQGLAAFAPNDVAWFLIRCDDPPSARCRPASGSCSTAARTRWTASFTDRRPPHRSGGHPGQRRSADRGQARAARTHDLPVVVVSRPPRPDMASVATSSPLPVG